MEDQIVLLIDNSHFTIQISIYQSGPGIRTIKFTEENFNPLYHSMRPGRPIVQFLRDKNAPRSHIQLVLLDTNFGVKDGVVVGVGVLWLLFFIFIFIFKALAKVLRRHQLARGWGIRLAAKTKE